MILLGLGSNMGERDKNLQQALGLLEADGTVRIDKISSIYETAPFGVTDQADFSNMVVRISTELSPEELLQKCIEVEKRMGRIRDRHWGPRIIDMDLLVYDNVQTRSEMLILPHPGIEHRAFVLIPLQEVAVRLRLPDGRTVEEMIAGSTEISEQVIRLWKKVDWDSSNKCFV